MATSVFLVFLLAQTDFFALDSVHSSVEILMSWPLKSIGMSTLDMGFNLFCASECLQLKELHRRALAICLTLTSFRVYHPESYQSNSATSGLQLMVDRFAQNIIEL